MKRHLTAFGYIAAGDRRSGQPDQCISRPLAKGSAYTTMNFTLQVENRIHLINVMRNYGNGEDNAGEEVSAGTPSE